MAGFVQEVKNKNLKQTQRHRVSVSNDYHLLIRAIKYTFCRYFYFERQLEKNKQNADMMDF